MSVPLARATAFLRAATSGTAATVDRVVLDHDGRAKRRHVVELEGGTGVLIDLAEVPHLRDGDSLVLDDGRLVAVVAASETLMRIEAATPEALIRLAWHLGNRHLAVQFDDGCLIARRDHVIWEMLEGLGATVSELAAPFEPESGAYHGHGGHSHG